MHECQNQNIYKVCGSPGHSNIINNDNLPILGLFATVGHPDSCKVQPIYWGIPQKVFFVASLLPGCILQGVFFFSQDPLYCY